MTPALDRAAFRRVATSHTGTKGLHHGTHNHQRSKLRTQIAHLPGLARHQQGRRQFLDQGRSCMAAPRRQGALVDPLRHPDERPDCSSAAASPAVNAESGRVPARPESGRGRGCKSRATRKIIWGIDADRAEHLLPQMLPHCEIASDEFEEKLLTL